MTRILLCILAFVTLCSLGLSLTCNDPNEEVKCMKSCPKERSCYYRFRDCGCNDDCIYYGETSPDTEKCKDMCVCKEGFYRSSNPLDNTCLTFQQCQEEEFREIAKLNKALNDNYARQGGPREGRLDDPPTLDTQQPGSPPGPPQGQRQSGPPQGPRQPGQPEDAVPPGPPQGPGGPPPSRY